MQQWLLLFFLGRCETQENDDSNKLLGSWWTDLRMWWSACPSSMGANPCWFATADEVEYPMILCNKWASWVREALQPHLQMSQQTHFASPDKTARTSTGKQTKRSPVTSRDYNEVKTALLSMEHESFTTRQILVTLMTAYTIPVHARIIRIYESHQKGGEQSDSKLFEVAFGTPWDDSSFITGQYGRVILLTCFKESQAPFLEPFEITFVWTLTLWCSGAQDGWRSGFQGLWSYVSRNLAYPSNFQNTGVPQRDPCWRGLPGHWSGWWNDSWLRLRRGH